MSREPLRVPLTPLAPGVRTLPPKAANYVVRVHRLNAGDPILAFDPEAAIEADATLIGIERRLAFVRVGEPRPASRRPRRQVTLIYAIGIADKMDAVVRDATELGATRVVPMTTARSVPRPEADRSSRWQRIAAEAARQSGRGDVPKIDPPLDFAAALGAVGTVASGLCLDPRGDVQLGARLRDLTPDSEVAFVVGPEGGLTEEEIAACVAAGFQRVRFGALTLRTETVCAAVLGALLAQATDAAR